MGPSVADEVLGEVLTLPGKMLSLLSTVMTGREPTSAIGGCSVWRGSPKTVVFAAVRGGSQGKRQVREGS
jgi:hypothetical protein